ncbi:MAG: hypothetical protein ACK4V6_20245, partial [Microthrixaceae bacterium]
AEREPLLGWQQQFRTESGGDAELAWSTPVVSRVLQAVQVLALLALLIVALRRRRLVAPAARRRARRIETPLVVVAPDGEVLSTDRTVAADPTDSGPGQDRGPGQDPEGAPKVDPSPEDAS